MRTAKRPTLRRLWLIDRELRKKTYPTLQQLAALAEVDEKTIRRDLRLLQETYRAPVVFRRARRGWTYESDNFFLPAVIMSEGELLAMYLAEQMLRVAQGAPYAEDLQRALQKLSEFLPDEVSVQWQSFDQMPSFRQSVVTQHDLEVFRTLSIAVLNRRQLRMTYWTASREAESERSIDPYHLLCVDGGAWYVLGWCHTRKAVRMFATSRIRQLQQTGKSFSPPQSFFLGDFFDGTFRVVSDPELPLQTVRLKFQPSAAKYIREKVWHPSQSITLRNDGSVLVEMSLRSFVEVRRWILSWGSECEVLEPSTLRADIHQEAVAILQQSAGVSQEAPAVPDSTPLRDLRRQVKTRKKKIG